MAIKDNLYITRGNSKEFAFELRDDEGEIVYDLAEATSLEFMLKDMELNEVLRLTPPVGMKVNVNKKISPAQGWVTVIINPADSTLDVGLYRFALQARWLDGRVREWTYSQVFYVLADLIP
jgi:hypothetical protein